MNGYEFQTPAGINDNNPDGITKLEKTLNVTSDENIEAYVEGNSDYFPIDVPVIPLGNNEYQVKLSMQTLENFGNQQENVTVYFNTEPNSIRDDPAHVPKKHVLYSNYPDPFNPETNLKYDLAKSAHVRIVVYNSLGQRVKTIVNRVQPMGQHTVKWDGTNNYGHSVSPGMYVARMIVKDNNQMLKEKMILTK